MSENPFLEIAVEAVADIIHAKGEATYPKNHVAAMRVPKGGSICSKCEYVSKDLKHCSNTYFITWEGPNKPSGSSKLPLPADEYCSDWFEAAPGLIKAATENSHTGPNKGTIWHGIKITGFSGPEEEGFRAMFSRVPPELLFNIANVEAAPELNAKHGQFIPETKTIKFNPKDFKLRQRLGTGPGWMLHQELTAVHEIGHSIYASLTPEKQKEWESLSGWMKGTKEGQAPVYVEKRPGWPPYTSKWTHKAGVQMPRHYSEKNPDEQFADCFAYVILGKGHMMDVPLKKFVDQLIHDNVRKYPTPLIANPTRPYLERDAIRHSKTV